MEQFGYNNIRKSYGFITIVAIIAFVAVLVKGAYIIFFERDYWTAVASRLKHEDVIITPRRGSIYSADGKLLVSNLPEYKIYFDFEAGYEKKDKALADSMDIICEGLHRIIPEKSAAAFRHDFAIGRTKRNDEGKLSQHYPLYKYRITYEQYKEILKLPVFCWPKYKGGFIAESYLMRKRIYGELASRTLGSIYADARDAKNGNIGRFGMERAYDSLLAGSIGKSHVTKVLNRFLKLVDEPAIDGIDLVSTIDVGMQDICEKALKDKMRTVGGEVGMVMVMDVETGDIKAIVNLTHNKHDGKYHEMKNNCIADLMEPGSTFKTASLMVAFDDNMVSYTDNIDTGNGICNMYGREMKDHNWEKGGYGVINVPRIMQVSSNVGIAKIIDEHYHNNPQKFIDGLYRIGIATDLKLDIPGAAKPLIKQPKDKGWSSTTLPWMSIGYESQLPVINTLTFYNAIANNGKMVKPRFITTLKKNGKILDRLPVEVLQEQICSEHTLKEIRAILQSVVETGSGEKAKTADFPVAGKTGTAQIARPDGKGYIWDDGLHHYMCSFCGYFPADKPKYSCIVAITKQGPYASGGMIAGPVFGKISSRIYAKIIRREVDSNASATMPEAKNGNMLALENAFKYLSIDYNNEWSGSYANGNPIWGRTKNSGSSITLTADSPCPKGVMPDVCGMGARDAVFLLERMGLKVRTVGMGQIYEQSIEAGAKVSKGSFVTIKLKARPQKKANVVKEEEQKIDYTKEATTN